MGIEMNTQGSFAAECAVGKGRTNSKMQGKIKSSQAPAKN